MKDRYIIICKDDDGKYRLLTRRTFNAEPALHNMFAGIAPSREPIIVACDSRTVILRKEDL